MLDVAIRDKTFADLKKIGVVAPLGKSEIPDIFKKVMIRPDGTDPMAEHVKNGYTGRQKDIQRGKKPSMPRAKSAFLRALDRNGWSLKNVDGDLCDPIDAVNVTFGKFRVSIFLEEWELFENEKSVHKQPFQAGSMQVVKRWSP